MKIGYLIPILILGMAWTVWSEAPQQVPLPDADATLQEWWDSTTPRDRYIAYHTIHMTVRFIGAALSAALNANDPVERIRTVVTTLYYMSLLNPLQMYDIMEDMRKIGEWNIISDRAAWWALYVIFKEAGQSPVLRDQYRGGRYGK